MIYSLISFELKGKEKRKKMKEQKAGKEGGRVEETFTKVAYNYALFLQSQLYYIFISFC